MPKGKRIRDGGLPDWPGVYCTSQGVATVTGRHCTIPRYRIIRAALKGLKLAGLLAIIVLGGCLLGKSDQQFSFHMFNVVQLRRLLIDQSVIQYLIAHRFDWVFQYRDYFMADQRFAGQRLANTVYAAAGILWLILFAVIGALNLPLFSGWLFAKRTTVRITSTHIVLYRHWCFARRFRRDAVGVIQFKVEAHPRLHSINSGGLSADVWRLYQQSGRLVMVYGARIEPIAIIVGPGMAGQFAVCCEYALTFTKRPSMGHATGTVTLIKVELE